jgi:hypothetical protein
MLIRNVSLGLRQNGLWSPAFNAERNVGLVDTQPVAKKSYVAYK